MRSILRRDISELAEKKQIKIVSFVPGERKVNDLVRANILELNVNADNYDHLIEFIELIEQSSYLMRVEKWSGHMTELSQNEKREVKKIVDARLEIAGLVIARDAMPAK